MTVLAPLGVPEAVLVTLEEFVAEDEKGAEPLVGDPDSILIPEGGDVMVYGDGGAGKTTLALDLAYHLAAGRDWLGIAVQRPVRVMLIENEGPRPLFRRKLRRKLEAWDELPTGAIHVLEQPWGRFTFAVEQWREEIALKIAAWEIDVIIAGPLVRIGMDEAGTLQDVIAFMHLVADLRERSQRPLAVVLIHHEGKSGTVSGAWEGAGDTLLHVRAAGNGHTVVFVQKARWASSQHRQTLKLAWTAGEGFELEVEPERDYRAELERLLDERGWMTLGEICAPTTDDPPGVGVREKVVKPILEGDPNTFEVRTGDAARALGRSPSARLWGLRRASVGAVGASLFSALPEDPESTTTTVPPPKGVGSRGRSSTDGDGVGGISTTGPVGDTPATVGGLRLLELVSRHVEEHSQCDAREVREAVPAADGATDEALGRLERAGFVERRDGRYRSFKPYRDGHDEVGGVS